MPSLPFIQVTATIVGVTELLYAMDLSSREVLLPEQQTVLSIGITGTPIFNALTLTMLIGTKPILDTLRPIERTTTSDRMAPRDIFFFFKNSKLADLAACSSFRMLILLKLLSSRTLWPQAPRDARPEHHICLLPLGLLAAVFIAC